MGEVSRWRCVAPVLAVALGLLALGAVLADLLGPTVLHQAEPGGPVANWPITLAVTLPCTAVGVLLAARPAGQPDRVHRAFEPAHVSIWSADGTGTR